MDAPDAIEADLTEQPQAERAAAVPPNEVVIDIQAQRGAGIVAAEVAYRSIPQVLEAPGRITLNENRTWRVGAVTEGRVVQVMAGPGDRVKEGQVLATRRAYEECGVDPATVGLREPLEPLSRRIVHFGAVGTGNAFKLIYNVLGAGDAFLSGLLSGLLRGRDWAESTRIANACGAIEAGFARAFRTIIDTHVTVLVTAAILYNFGTGPVKGFAVTLFIGLAASLFTAVFFTRLLFDVIYLGRRKVATVSI